MRSSLLWRVAIVAVVAASGGATGGHAAVLGRGQTKMVVVAHTVTSPNVGMHSKVTIDVGRLDVIKGSLALTRGAMRSPTDTASKFLGLEVLDYSKLTKTVCNTTYDFLLEGSDDGAACSEVPYTETDITASADASIASASSRIAQQLSALAKDHGATSAVYTFDQELAIPGKSGRRRLVWSLLVDASGRAIYGTTKIAKSDQTYLYVSYTPLRVSKGLPQEWQYPDAGTMSWMLVDTKFRPVGPATSIDTGGYFDEPDESTGGELELKCLLKKAFAGCSSPYPDVATLIAQSGADGAFVDYAHLVEPVYDNVEFPVGSGQNTMKARLTMSIPTRNVTQTLDLQCKNPQYFYQNSGKFQFELNLSMTRFFIDSAATNYLPVGRMETQKVSPFKDYSLTLQVDGGFLDALPSVFIAPFVNDEPLLSVGLLSATSTVSPVIFHPPPKCIPAPLPPPSK